VGAEAASDSGLLGWAFHLLIDIPTHQGIFAIHFLWPISSYGFNGHSLDSGWSSWRNYGVVTFVFAGLQMRAMVAFRCDLS